MTMAHLGRPLASIVFSSLCRSAAEWENDWIIVHVPFLFSSDSWWPIRPVGHEYFSDRHWKRQDRYRKLPKYDCDIPNDPEQRNLHHSSFPSRLQNASQDPQRQQHRIEAVQVVGDGQGSVLDSGWGMGRHQAKDEDYE